MLVCGPGRAARRFRDFEGRTALVTGAAGGIGRASALAFARRGASVLVADVSDQALETVELAEELGVKAHFVRTDVGDPKSIAAAVDTAVERFGRLDFAHNNAGIGMPGAVADLEEDGWDRAIWINLNGASSTE
ncbi:SDR family NAD(P)-dependent oxidoreductase [Streptomyces sp. NPDC001530]|uniref:SDR family NAD(P)-dependent oxidoreductase n=1 Tax=Streptomyces sp. NPDC001530 TaxID=3364582 RepID=UPI003689DB2B